MACGWFSAASILAAGTLLTMSSGAPARAQQWLPPIQKVPHIFVQTEVLGQRGGVTRSLGKGSIEASPGRPGNFTLSLDLGPASADHPTSIEIEVTQNETGEKIGLTVTTTVAVTSRTGQVTHMRRERIAEVDEGRSFFHQAYENASEGTSILLTMTPDTRVVPQLVKPKLSAPVVFNVTLSRVTPSGEVPIEDNVLRTLEGSPVSYSFRISTSGRAPVEATVPADSAGAAPGDPAAPAAPESGASAATLPIPAEDTSATGADPSAPDTKDAKNKKAKPKKMSRKEREKQALAEFQKAREAASASTSSAAADGASEKTAAGTAPDGSSPAAGPPAGSAPPPDGDGTTESSPAASATAEQALSADELELTLLPRRVESGILMVEASLRGRAPGKGTELATLVQRTHALSPNSSFDIALKGPGPGGEGSYKFTVQARF